MDSMQILKIIAAENGGIVETMVASQQGVSRAMLSKLCGDGHIQRIARGQYIFPDDMQDELLGISKRSRQVIFSHETALYLHGISDRTPFEHTVTVPSGSKPASFIRETCKLYYIKPPLFQLGKIMLLTPAGNCVPAYDLERTICDTVRSRNKIGTETFLAALKAYAASSKKNLNLLHSYAKEMGVEGVVRKYLEVLL